MMKKLLILMTILGVASVTNADLAFTINGVPQPNEITIGVGDAVGLGLELPTGTIRCYDLVYELSNAQAELITTGFGDYPAISFPAPFDAAAGVMPGATAQMVEIYVPSDIVDLGASPVLPLVAPLPAPQTLMLNMVLHCLEATDVVLTVTTVGALGNYWDGQQIAPGTVVNTLLMHQTPEPLTIALLALGGLFLRRRRR
jgi:hypothetical protein